jgi:hypothetical protein
VNSRFATIVDIKPGAIIFSSAGEMNYYLVLGDGEEGRVKTIDLNRNEICCFIKKSFLTAGLGFLLIA